jgi:hypothetical protein
MADMVSGAMSPVQVGSPAATQGPDPLEVVKTIVGLKQQKQAMAQQTLQVQMEMIKQGAPIDASQIEKTAKEAGIDFAQLSSNLVAPQINPNQVASAGAAAGGPNSGYQSATPVSTQAAGKSPAGGQQPPVVGANATKSGVAGAQRQAPQNLQQWIQQKQQSYLQQLDLAEAEQGVKMQLAQTQQAAIDKFHTTGDARDFGMMLSSLGQNVNADMIDRLSMTGTQYKTMLDVASGAESQAQKQKRRSDIYTNLATNTEFMSTLQNPDDVNTVVDALTEGKPIPPTVKRRQSITQTVQRAQLYNDYARTFDATPQQLMSMVDAAMATGNPMSAIPDSIKTHSANQLAQQRAHDIATEGIQRGQLEATYANIAVEARKLDAALAKNTEAAQAWTMLEQASRAGVDLPPGTERAAWDIIAKSAGMKTEDMGIFSRLLRFDIPGVGKTSFELVPQEGLTEQQMNSLITGPQQGGPGMSEMPGGMWLVPPSPQQQQREQKYKQQEETDKAIRKGVKLNP